MSLTGSNVPEIGAAIRAWFECGLRAVDPFQATCSAIEWNGSAMRVHGDELSVPTNAHIVGIAIGKAAADMARALDAVLGDRLTAGFLLTKDAHAPSPPLAWRIFEASHPVPDERGVRATQDILEAVGELHADDLVIALISGGGSALLESPKPPLTLADVQRVTSLMLRAGAPIQDLNAVRSELSEVKGGGLRRSIAPARCISLILSDVIGNDPSVIASGPTTQRPADPGRAKQLLVDYSLIDQVPAVVIDVLDRQPELPTSGLEPDYDLFAIVGDNAMFLQAITTAANADGHSVKVVMESAEGEARTMAHRFLDLANQQPEDVDVVIGGGEATVTVTGAGQGGRNTEFALEAAIRLHGASSPWVVASLASDGQDGSIDAAGAIVDAETVARGELIGLSAEDSLGDNDSGGYFAALHELVETGPTGTNVNDVYLAVRAPVRKVIV